MQVSNFVLREFKRIRGNKKGQVDEELRFETILTLLWTAPENMNFSKEENRKVMCLVLVH